MNPALETLLIPFASGEIAVPPRALFLGAEPHSELRKWPSVTGWQPFKPLADAWEAGGLPRTDDPTGTWPLVLLLPGKAKDDVLASFARAYDALELGGSLVVAMPNGAGAQRFEKELRKAAGSAGSWQKNKCRVFRAVRHDAWNEALLAEWRTLGAPRTVDGFAVTAGVFSSGHIDPGSALLAEHLPRDLRGAIADLGAGWGFLSKAVADRCPGMRSIDLFEADARALACARRNLIGENFRFHWHDVAAGVPGTFDAIVSNPPFHSGQSTDVDLGKAFLRSAASGLRAGGRLLVVANRQLPYEAELDRLGLAWRKPVEDATYKLLFAEKRTMDHRPLKRR